jgi:hypothetical protein
VGMTASVVKDMPNGSVILGPKSDVYTKEDKKTSRILNLFFN